MTQGKSPWDHRRWRDGICRSGLGAKAVTFWVVAILFLGVAVGIALKAPHMLHFARERWAVLIPFGFMAVGLIFVVVALIATARWLRFGGCYVRMRTVPGVIGGHFRGEVLLPETFPQDTDVRMELVCETTTTITGKGDSSDHLSVDREWAHTQRVSANASLCHDGHCAIPFDFTVPYGLADATDSHRNGDTRVDIQWRLRVFARLAGPDLNMSFLVPVFRTAASDPSVKGDSCAEKNLDAFLHETGEQRRIRMETVQGATVYICGAQGMKKGLGLIPLAFGLVMLSAAVLVPCNALPELVKEIAKPAVGWYNLFRLFPLFFACATCLMTGVLGLFGLLLLFIGVRGFIVRRTWIEKDWLRQHARLFGIPWTRSCPCASATGVNLGDTSTSGGKTWYDVVIERNTVSHYQKAKWRYLFSRITVATNVPTRQEAEDLVVRLRRELHLPEGAEGV